MKHEWHIKDWSRGGLPSGGYGFGENDYVPWIREYDI